jgi:hypothetical protein
MLLHVVVMWESKVDDVDDEDRRREMIGLFFGVGGIEDRSR